MSDYEIIMVIFGTATLLLVFGSFILKVISFLEKRK